MTDPYLRPAARGRERTRVLAVAAATLLWTFSPVAGEAPSGGHGNGGVPGVPSAATANPLDVAALTSRGGGVDPRSAPPLVSPEDRADEDLLAAMEARGDVLDDLAEVAEGQDVDRDLMAAVAWHESEWRMSIVSSVGAIGVMQVMPDTGRQVAGKIDESIDLGDRSDNLRAGAVFLDWMLDRYDGDERAALIAYNQGPVAYERNGAYSVAERYAEDVLATRDVLAELGW